MRRRVAILLLVGSGLVYLLTAPGHLGTVDMRAEFAVSQSIVGSGDATVASSLPYNTVPYVVAPNGGHYAAHEVGQSLLLLPAAIVGRLAGCGAPATCSAMAQHDAEFAASFLDAAAAAVAVMLIFLLALDLGAGLVPAVGLAVLFGFTTIEWAYAHDAFDVGPSATALLLAVYATHRGLRLGSGRWLAAAGAAAGFAVALRVPSLVCAPFLGLYVIGATWRSGMRLVIRRTLWYGVPVAIVLLALAWYNWSRFGDPLQFGYSYASDYYGFGGSLPSGVAGFLFSPGRSIFVYSPILLAALAGIPLFFKQHRGLTLTLGGMVVATIGFYSLYPVWWGSWGWGPRYLVPIMPFLLLPLLPLLQRWRELPRWARSAVYGLAVIGVLVQVLDIGVELQHQMQLLIEAGVQPPDAQFWTPQYSGIWLDGKAMVGLIAGSAAYPTTYQFTDIATAIPLKTVFDTWWVYAWVNGVNPLVILTVVLGALGGIAACARRLWAVVQLP